MNLHEKTLELNITHKLLNLADSWYWFLTDSVLWRYWRPKYKLPFLKYPKSTAAGLHTNVEGKDDPTGEAGGGYDVRIKAGSGGYLLFIQYKRGEVENGNPKMPNSIFNNPVRENFVFTINSTSTNQHFTLKKLAEGKGGEIGNAVVYAFPLIVTMKEVEKHAGDLLRRTKFMSISDIEFEALKNDQAIEKDKEHKIRIDKKNIDCCEANYLLLLLPGLAFDKTGDVVADVLLLKFDYYLKYFLTNIKEEFDELGLHIGYIPLGLRQAFIQYIRFLLNYFEVKPEHVIFPFAEVTIDDFYAIEFSDYEGNDRDKRIVNTILVALVPFVKFIFSLEEGKEIDIHTIPSYKPQLFIPRDYESDMVFSFDSSFTEESFENISYLII